MKFGQLIAFFIFAVVVSSCSTFTHMHYRHVKKVPANGIIFESQAREKSARMQFAPSRDSFLIDCCENSAEELISVESGSNKKFYHDVKNVESDSTYNATTVLHERIKEDVYPQLPKRHDWSLLIALLMIFAGLLLIFYIVVLLSAPAIMLLGRILLSMILASAAAKMLVVGISIFVNRFRTRKTYTESKPG